MSYHRYIHLDEPWYFNNHNCSSGAVALFKRRAQHSQLIGALESNFRAADQSNCRGEQSFKDLLKYLSLPFLSVPAGGDYHHLLQQGRDKGDCSSVKK